MKLVREDEAAVLDRLKLQAGFSQTEIYRHFVPRQFLLQWHVTERCNLRCRHCYQDFEEVPAELTDDEQEAVLDQYLQLLQAWNIPGHINFTGGEPFLRAGFLGLLERVAASREFCSFSVLSNGSLLDDALAARLHELHCRFFQISIDGNEAVHDQIRGRGNFRKCLAALACLRRNGVSSMVSFTVHRQNAAAFPEVATICQAHKVDVLWADRMLPLGRAGSWSEEILEAPELEEFFRKMHGLRQVCRGGWFHRTDLRMHRALQFLTLQECGEAAGRPYRCNAGRSLLTLMPNGEVLPCRRLPVVVGNVREKTLREIYRESLLLINLRNPERRSRGCEICAHGRECHGGLRCMSYACHGDPFVADPQCFHFRRYFGRLFPSLAQPNQKGAIHAQ